MESIIFLLILLVIIIFIVKSIYNKKNTVPKPETSLSPPIPTTTSSISKESLQLRDDYPFKKEMFNFLKNSKGVIFFDLETNGLNLNFSVLSCSAIKCDVDLNKAKIYPVEHFNRYYYPVEPYERKAIEINRLTKSVIKKRRTESCGYPEYFVEDKEFEKFCDGVTHYVAHNMDFDSMFVPFIKRKKTFCTMKLNTGVVKTPYLRWKNDFKWPTLTETARHYGVSINESTLHESMSDVEMTMKIFERMLEKATLNT